MSRRPVPKDTLVAEYLKPSQCLGTSKATSALVMLRGVPHDPVGRHAPCPDCGADLGCERCSGIDPTCMSCLEKLTPAQRAVNVRKLREVIQSLTLKTAMSDLRDARKLIKSIPRDAIPEPNGQRERGVPAGATPDAGPRPWNAIED